MVATTLNGVHLTELLSNAVLITHDTEVESLVEFENNVVLLNCLEVYGDLKTRFLSGVDLKYWIDNAIYTNKEMLEGEEIYRMFPNLVSTIYSVNLKKYVENV